MILGRGYGYTLGWRREKAIEHRASNPHIITVGKPGAGKTVADYYWFAQDLAQAVIQIDAHGDLFRRCLERLIAEGVPPEEVIIIDPTYKPGELGTPQLAMLEVGEGEVPYEAVDGVVSCFQSIFKQGLMERGSDILRNCCLTMQEAGLSLAEIPLLLTKEEVRHAVMQRVTDFDVQMFWSQFAKLKSNEFANFVESTRNKLSAFLMNPYIKPVLSATTSSVNFFEAMNTRKKILVNLSRDRLKQESRGLLGSLIMQKFTAAVLQRQRLPEDRRPQVSIYCDEAHEYYHKDAFLPLFEGARKFNVGMRMFFQSLSQFPPEDADVLLGTAGTLVAFSVGRKDAERLAKEMMSFSGKEVKEQSRNLWGPKEKPRYFTVQEEFEHAVAQIMRSDIGECVISMGKSPYFGEIPNPVYPAIRPALVEEFRKESAKRYARTLEEITAAERQRLAACEPKDEFSAGRKRKSAK